MANDLVRTFEALLLLNFSVPHFQRGELESGLTIGPAQWWFQLLSAGDFMTPFSFQAPLLQSIVKWSAGLEAEALIYQYFWCLWCWLDSFSL